MRQQLIHHQPLKAIKIIFCGQMCPQYLKILAAIKIVMVFLFFQKYFFRREKLLYFLLLKIFCGIFEKR